MRLLFSKTNLTVLTFAAAILPAHAAGNGSEGVHIPHTGIWVEQAKASDYLDNTTSYGRVYGSNEVLFITKVEGRPGGKRPKHGDIIQTVNNWPVNNLKQLSDVVEDLQKAGEANGIAKVVREDQDMSVFLKIE